MMRFELGLEQPDPQRALRSAWTIAKACGHASSNKSMKVHATIEEEILYPSVRKQIDDAGMIYEATEEHHVAKLR